MKPSLKLLFLAPLLACACSVLNLGLYNSPPYEYPEGEKAAKALAAPYGSAAGSREVLAGLPSDLSAFRIFDFSKENVRPPFGQRSSPLVVGDFCLFGNSNAEVRAISLADGRTLWQNKAQGAIYSTPVYAGGNAVFADDAGFVTAFSLQGEIKWGVALGYPAVADLLSDGEKIFILSADQKIYCLKAADGSPLWQYSARAPRENRLWRASSIALGDGLYVGTSEGYVIKIDPNDGAMIWRSKVAEKGLMPDICAGPAVDGSVVYAGAEDGPLAALEASTGKILWSKEGKASCGVAVSGQKLIFGGRDGSITALSKADGAALWKSAPEAGKAPSFVMAAGGEVLAGYFDGPLYALEMETGKVSRSYSTGSGIGAMPWLGGEGAVIHSNAGKIHLLGR